MCIQAWNIYLTIILPHNPARAVELVGYQCITPLLTSPYQCFSMMGSCCCQPLPLLGDQHHPELCGTRPWPLLIASNTYIKRWPCPYCEPIPNNFSCLLFRDSAQNTRPLNYGAPRTPICGDFNNRQCTRSLCTFQHICLSCKGLHLLCRQETCQPKLIRLDLCNDNHSLLCVTKFPINHCFHSSILCSQIFNQYSTQSIPTVLTSTQWNASHALKPHNNSLLPQCMLPVCKFTFASVAPNFKHSKMLHHAQ